MTFVWDQYWGVCVRHLRNNVFFLYFLPIEYEDGNTESQGKLILYNRAELKTSDHRQVLLQCSCVNRKSVEQYSSFRSYIFVFVTVIGHIGVMKMSLYQWKMTVVFYRTSQLYYYWTLNIFQSQYKYHVSNDANEFLPNACYNFKCDTV